MTFCLGFQSEIVLAALSLLRLNVRFFFVPLASKKKLSKKKCRWGMRCRGYAPDPLRPLFKKAGENKGNIAVKSLYLFTFYS